jgi:diaminopimelate decarboxylase
MGASAALTGIDGDPDIGTLIARHPGLSMHAMDGLVLDQVPLAAIAAAVGTPTWVYAAPTMRRRAAALAQAFAAAGLGVKIHYAVKANDHLAVLRVFAAAGAGADVVSGGEFLRARAAGIAPADIVFSGVGKQDSELRLALAQDIAQINVESAEELAMLSALAAGMGRTARVALRVNPDVEPGTHAKITTGVAGNKFGIPHQEAVSLYAHAAGMPGITPVGFAVHIGSQIASTQPYRAAYERVANLVRGVRQLGHRVESVDCGGGLGIAYRAEPAASPAAFAGVVRATLGDLDVELKVEFGRWLVAPAGVLLARVILVKQAAPRAFVVLDAAMNDLVRPAMYDAWHGIVPLSAADAVRPVALVDVVGPVCESGDTFTRARALPTMQPGAAVAILDAGAYGAVMSSTYNARPLAAQVMIDAGRWAVIRDRQSPEMLWAGEYMPEFAAK